MCVSGGVIKHSLMMMDVCVCGCEWTDTCGGCMWVCVRGIQWVGPGISHCAWLFVCISVSNGTAINTCRDLRKFGESKE